ncbi:MAG: hypothetical protein ACE5HU_04445 [Acidobacteriota bacterium]
MVSKTRVRARLLTALLCVACLAVIPAEAARVRSLGLGDMSARAGRIFVGRCAQVTVGVDAATHIPATTYTFIVTRPIKGVNLGPLTFRIPGTPQRPFLAGLPVFTKGEEALLFLYPESEAGFSTVLGLDQGRFRIIQKPDGSRRVINHRANAGLLRAVPERVLKDHGLKRHGSGSLPLDGFIAATRALAARVRR